MKYAVVLTLGANLDRLSPFDVLVDNIPTKAEAISELDVLMNRIVTDETVLLDGTEPVSLKKSQLNGYVVKHADPSRNFTLGAPGSGKHSFRNLHIYVRREN
jgi:hypothetical protein